jgi:ligand-binding sensor domain-containing protein/serine phosphatase RsbU (regulator of sigma subunit)
VKHALLLVLVFFGLNPALSSQEFGFEIYNQDNGLTASYIYDIRQDEVGNICLATETGLVLYNGSSFNTYDTTDGLNENMVRSVCVTGNKILLGHFQEGLSFGRTIFHRVANTPESLHRVKTTLEVVNDTVLVGTSGSGLFVFTASGELKNFPDLQRTSVNALCSFGDNMIAVGTEDGISFLQFTKGTFSLVTEIPELRGQSISAATSDSSGNIFVAIRDGGIAHIRSEGRNYTCEIVPREDLYLPDGECASMATDNRGNLFIAVMGEGLFQYNYYRTMGSMFAVLVQSYTSFNGLPTDNIQTVFVDSESNLWIGTYGRGLVKYANQKFYNIKFNYAGLPAPVAALEIFNTKYYAGTSTGLYEIQTSERGQVSMKLVGDSLELPAGPVKLIHNRSAILFVVVNEHDMFRLEVGKKCERINIPFRNAGPVINDLESAEDEVYISTSEGLFIYSLATKEFTLYNTENGLLHNQVKTAMRDSKGRIWITSPASKVAYLKEGQVHIPDALSGEQSYLVHCVMEDPKGNIWMGTDGDGLLCYDGRGVRILTSDSGLASNYIYSLSLRADNSIWAVHNRSLSRITRDESDIRSYTSPFEFTNREFIPGAVMNAPGGQIYFGTSLGILVFDPLNDIPNPRGPYCSINSITFDTTLFFAGENIDLDYHKYNVRFDFLGISHTDPTGIIYKYKLEGVDDVWRTSDYTQRYATYPQLADGDYTFRVYCYTANNPILSNEVAVPFTIGIPFWKSYWFYIFLLGILIVSVYLYVKWKVQIYKIRQQQLQVIIAAKTSELTKEKEELLLTKSLLEEVNKDTADSISYAKQIQEVMLPGRESILNKFPDSLVYHRASHVVSGDFYWFSESADHYLIGVVDCTGHGVPGAFMSLISANLLDKIITNRRIISPVDILYAMDASTVQALHQDEKQSTSRDGMDIAICAISKDKKKMRFGGAGRPLYLVRNGELTEYKGSKISIGGYYAGVKKNFFEQEIEIQPGDVIYLSSDGYADQFNQDNEKKYSSKRLKELLASIAHLEAGWQYAELHTSFEDWKGGTRQIDDVTIVGFKI